MSITIGSILPVGTVLTSMLTSTQFASEYGDNWVLADGRSVTGTKYANVTGNSTIPDMRGAFLRGKGSSHNPDGDLALGTYTADKTASHNHQERALSGVNGSPEGLTYDTSSGTGSSIKYITYINGNVSNTGTNYPLTTANTGDNETAPKNITVNYFIRIN